jgi:hypothetical protein
MGGGSQLLSRKLSSRRRDNYPGSLPDSGLVKIPALAGNVPRANFLRWWPARPGNRVDWLKTNALRFLVDATPKVSSSGLSRGPIIQQAQKEKIQSTPRQRFIKRQSVGSRNQLEAPLRDADALTRPAAWQAEFAHFALSPFAPRARWGEEILSSAT